MRCWTAKPWVWTLTHLTVTQEFVLLSFLPSSIFTPLFVRPSVTRCLVCPHVQVEELIWSQVIDRCKLYQRIKYTLLQWLNCVVVLLRMSYCKLPVDVGCWVMQQESSGSIQPLLQWHSWSSLEGGGVRQRVVTVGEGRLDTKVFWSLQLKYMAACFLLHFHASISSAN